MNGVAIALLVAAVVLTTLLWTGDRRLENYRNPEVKGWLDRAVPFRWFRPELFTAEGQPLRRRLIAYLLGFFLLALFFLSAAGARRVS